MPAKQPTILATSMGFNRARDPWQPSPVFQYAFDLAGTNRARLCFISTGTGDRPDSIANFTSAFEGTDVQSSHLTLFDKPNVADIAEHLHQQDVIWIDRGSLANLLAVWRVHKVDTILRECWERGVVLAGESAGSLCWFSGGTTDSFGEVSVLNDGLALLPYSNAVHYSDRREQFQAAIKRDELPDGYATDAGAGLHFEGTQLVAAISDRANAGAYHVKRTTRDEIEETPLPVERLKRSA
ncbi:peptidase E [Actinokineospora sp. UTMC 2448]|uniref:Type 1 glutamine amidotransferase-like domain-containing protein n=1 Tax=Actinokineospora sp. UTMC 2448 TaxID=2268449 RepID=UPI00216451E1|nr:peptidase E [Actinokineospora sp. UTMC 2448]UVS80602.1 Peptidase E [Actinokineospora sp. UTMC 2448]